MRLFSNVWSENTALLERLMEIHSNAPKLYYGFKRPKKLCTSCVSSFVTVMRQCPVFVHNNGKTWTEGNWTCVAKL